MRNVSRRSLLAAAGASLAAPAARASQSGTQDRRTRAFEVRLECALQERDVSPPNQVSNGDEGLYFNKLGNFSKGLPHNDLGEVDPGAYASFVDAISSGDMARMEALTMGSPDPRLQLKLVNPFAGLAFDLEGADSDSLTQPPAPRLTSAEAGGEMAELYWMALARDVSFLDYDNHETTRAAAADLSRLSDFRGPRVQGQVTTATVFRGLTPGDLAGPYLSQFLWRPIPFGVQVTDQRLRTMAPGVDYATNYAAWLALQRGIDPQTPEKFDGARRWVRNGRDLARWVHIDVLYQAYFNAFLILATPPDPSDDLTGGGLGAPLNPGNPYNSSRTQIGFGTFGGPYMATILPEVSTRALKAVWRQKWLVHRRLRPEAFGGRVHNKLAAGAGYFLHDDLLNSAALSRVKSANGTWLLPQAYPEGCPLHPSYGAGHATVAGACVTILKALFDENYAIPNPVAASADGLSLVSYTGPDANRLTVGGELNKLAANIATGRNFAGIHYRSDYAQSIRLGEAVAISVLRDQRLTYAEDFHGFTFTTFDGEKITV
jgi:hypothetical protein